MHNNRALVPLARYVMRYAVRVNRASCVTASVTCSAPYNAILQVQTYIYSCAKMQDAHNGAYKQGYPSQCRITSANVPTIARYIKTRNPAKILFDVQAIIGAFLRVVGVL